jgi:hypothetical protein
VLSDASSSVQVGQRFVCILEFAFTPYLVRLSEAPLEYRILVPSFTIVA